MFFFSLHSRYFVSLEVVQGENNRGCFMRWIIAMSLEIFSATDCGLLVSRYFLRHGYKNKYIYIYYGLKEIYSKHIYIYIYIYTVFIE